MRAPLLRLYTSSLRAKYVGSLRGRRGLAPITAVVQLQKYTRPGCMPPFDLALARNCNEPLAEVTASAARFFVGCATCARSLCTASVGLRWVQVKKV